MSAVILFSLLANVLLLGAAAAAAGQSFAPPGGTHVSPAPLGMHNTRGPPLRVPVIKGRIPYNLDSKSLPSSSLLSMSSPPPLLITNSPSKTPIRIAAPSAKLKNVNNNNKLPSASNKLQQHTAVSPIGKPAPTTTKDKVEVIHGHKATSGGKDVGKSVANGEKAKQPKVYQAAESKVTKMVS